MSHALSFARRTAAARTVLFHHDPMHSDERLDRLAEEGRARWLELGGSEDAIGLGMEGGEYELPARAPAPGAVATA